MNSGRTIEQFASDGNDKGKQPLIHVWKLDISEAVSSIKRLQIKNRNFIIEKVYFCCRADCGQLSCPEINTKNNVEDLAKAERTVEAMYTFLISSRIDAEMTAIRLELKHIKIWLISVCLMHESQG